MLAFSLDVACADQTVPPNATNRAILGPTGELLPPILSTQLLGEEDYFEWCLQWNKTQYAQASARAVPPRVISGWLTNRTSYTQSGTAGGLFGRARRGSRDSTSQSRGQEWRVGGYGGGPVTIYNPFVPPKLDASREPGI
jgi:hypothetical protein